MSPDTAKDASVKTARPFLRRIRWRSILSFISLALAILCLIVGSLFVWVRATAYNPDGFVQAALSVEGQVGLQDQLASYVQNEVVTQKRAEEAASQVVEPLPLSQDRKAFLVTALATALRSQVGNIVQNALNSDAAQKLIREVSTRGSQAFVALIKGEPGALKFQGDKIVFDTEPLLKDVRANINENLGPVAKYLPTPFATEGYPQYVIAQGSTVTTIQSIISFVDLMSWLLPVLFLVLLIIGILLARNRRAAAYRAMIAIAVSAVVVLIALRITKSAIAGLLSEPATEQVYDAILTQMGSKLLDQTLWLTLLAAIIAFVLWVFGPDNLAVKLRAWFGRRWRDLLVGKPSPAGRVTQFARQFGRHLEVGGVVLAAIVMIAIPSVTLSTWLLAIIALVIWFVLIELARTAGWLSAIARRLSKQPAATA